jgi:hypothetical protein
MPRLSRELAEVRSAAGRAGAGSLLSGKSKPKIRNALIAITSIVSKDNLQNRWKNLNMLYALGRGGKKEPYPLFRWYQSGYPRELCCGERIRAWPRAKRGVKEPPWTSRSGWARKRSAAS